VHNLRPVTQWSPQISLLCRGDGFLTTWEAVHRRTTSPLGLRSLFRRFLLFGDLLLRFAPHLDERIDKIIDRLMPFRLASHPDQGVQKLIDRFIFLCHAAC
jgi:hypothetical protein